MVYKLPGAATSVDVFDKGVPIGRIIGGQDGKSTARLRQI